MNIKYDPKTDTIYIKFSEKKSTRTVEASDSLLLDYAGKKLIGIEVLDASKNTLLKDLGSVNFKPSFK